MALKQMEDIHNLGLVSSVSDRRTVNNTMRHQYRVLSDEEKLSMQHVKDLGEALTEAIILLGDDPELTTARIKVREAVMWSVSYITR